MKFRVAMAVAPLLLAAACGKSGDTITNEAAATPPSPVANATPDAMTAPVSAPITPTGQAWIDTVVQTPEGGFRMGNPDAPVKLVEFGSRTCPHCAVFSQETRDAMRTFVASGKVSYEFRDYPIHAQDLAAILVGQCGGPGTFFPILEQMLDAQDTVLAKLDPAKFPADIQKQLTNKTPNQAAAYWADYLGYVDFVKQRGVPDAKARACLADTKATDRIAKQLEQASAKYNIPGTPTFLVNGKMDESIYNLETLNAALKGAGA